MPPDCDMGTGGTARPAEADNAVSANRAADMNVEGPKRLLACGTNHAEVDFLEAGVGGDAVTGVGGN